MRLTPLLLLAFACDTPADPGDSADTGEAAIPAPVPELERFCRGRAWADDTAPVVMPAESKRARGYATDAMPVGTVEVSKFVPAHPLHVTRLRVQFAEGQGTARIRLMGTQGRSYPAGYPDLDAEGATIAGPFDVEVSATWGDDAWTEIDLADDEVYLLPGQHYTVVNEYVEAGGPRVAYTGNPSDLNSRALLIVAGAAEPYGLPGDYLMEIVGESVCAWSAEERWFGEVSTPFGAGPGGNLAMADLDGDGHQDFVLHGGDSRAWLGDGAGGFTAAGSLWPEAAYASWLLFGDVDNDGDTDTFAASYVTPDADGDGWTLQEGDCDDVDAGVNPREDEVSDGQDNDCDGVADDGTDAEDADADGQAVVDGDCDDRDDTVGLGFVELKDQVDNDCDLAVDEDFPSRVLLNDGTGAFAAVTAAGVEVTEPSTAGAFSDADGDGDLDVYFGNWLLHYPNDPALDGRYYEGAGDGTFTDAFDAAGLRMNEAYSVYGVTWTDYDNDAWPDLLVANYHLYDNQLWHNLGDGTFEDVAQELGVDHDEIKTESPGYPGGHSYGGDFGDIDGDGDLDYFQSNLCHPRTWPWADQSTLNVSAGPPDWTFTNEARARGLEYDEGDVQGQFGDYDNDGDLDLVVSSLYPNHYPRVYQNDGTGHFTDVTYEVGLDVQTSFGVLWADMDEDGDLDLFVNGSYGDTLVHLLENRIGTERHWLEFDVEGVAAGKDAAGARVSVTAGGVTRFRDVLVGGGSFNQQRPTTLHFGLGDATAVESVTVRWVGGATETFSGVEVDRRWTLVQGAGRAD